MSVSTKERVQQLTDRIQRVLEGIQPIPGAKQKELASNEVVNLLVDAAEYTVMADELADSSSSKDGKEGNGDAALIGVGIRSSCCGKGKLSPHKRHHRGACVSPDPAKFLPPATQPAAPKDARTDVPTERVPADKKTGDCTCGNGLHWDEFISASATDTDRAIGELSETLLIRAESLVARAEQMSNRLA